MGAPDRVAVTFSGKTSAATLLVWKQPIVKDDTIITIRLIFVQGYFHGQEP